VAPEIEAAVVALAIEQPAFGQLRVANEVCKRGIMISPALRGAAPRSRDYEQTAEGAVSPER
jgi:hypothetical protein